MKYLDGTIAIFLSILLHTAMCAEPLTGSEATKEGIEETIIRVLQTGMHTVDLLEEESIQSKCKVSSQVTCKLSSTGQDCDDLVVPIDQCGEIDLDFTFTFCNLENEFIALKSDKTIGLVNTKAVNELNLSNLNKGECRSETVTRKVNTCKRFFSASLKVEGLRGGRPGGIGQDYCYAWDFLRVFIKRECEVTSEISCTVVDTGEDCMSIIRPTDACGMEDMIFSFNYCNNESTTLELHKQRTLALIETDPIVPNLNLANIPPQTCRTITVPKTINTCKRFFSARLKVEGWRGDGPGDYCFAWDFFRSYPIRPDGGNGGEGGNTNTGDGNCAVTARVKSCNLFPSGDDCDDIVVPLESCNEEESMVFEFEYCNFETDSAKTITLIPQKTIALIDTVGVADLNTSRLLPGQCHTRREFRKVNTCKRFFSASLKVEGWREFPYYTEGNYCFAYNFYRSYLTRPDGEGGAAGTDCDVTADVQCTLESNGQDCAAAIYPLDQCSENTPMILSFEYCNQNPTQFIDLKEDKTIALVNTQNIDGLNKSDIPPGKCRRLFVTRNINTCKRFFSASLKVEGLRNGVIGDYCYGWDFYRNYFKRLPDINNGGSENPNPPSSATTCAVTASVSCTVDATGQDCDDIIVPLEACNTATPMTFEFEYCNYSVNQPVSLHEDKTIALVQTVPAALTYADMRPGECFRRVVTRNIDTCKRFFSASLKVEGLLADESDYCYAWDFYRSYITRPDTGPTPSAPSPSVGSPTPFTECQVTSNVSCVITNDPGTACEDIIVPLDECGNTEMTFTFEYCNTDQYAVNFKKVDGEELTIAKINTQNVNLDLSRLEAGMCHRVVENRMIDTCKRLFSASLKVEALQDTVKDYCYAWDFYRSYIRRPGEECENITGPEKEALVRSIVSNVSNAAALNTPGTPQFRALDWLINIDTYNVFCAADCNRNGQFGGVIQRYTLAVFYFSTNGDTWASCGRNSINCVPQLSISPNDPIDTFFGSQTWLSSAHECLWGGVSCRTSTECMDRIEFEGENVNGVIPFELEQLFELRYLYLEGANNDAEYFSDSFEYLSGTIPPQLQTLTELLILDLNYNKLSGPLPAALWNLVSLRQLDLDHNLFTGTITGNNLKRLQNLQFLQVNDNLFTGQIPDFGGQNALNSILVAEFHNNGFTGNMPPGNCRLVTPAGLLEKLSSDCLGGASAPVICEVNVCCTECF